MKPQVFSPNEHPVLGPCIKHSFTCLVLKNAVFCECSVYSNLFLCLYPWLLAIHKGDICVCPPKKEVQTKHCSMLYRPENSQGMHVEALMMHALLLIVIPLKLPLILLYENIYWDLVF